MPFCRVADPQLIALCRFSTIISPTECPKFRFMKRGCWRRNQRSGTIPRFRSALSSIGVYAWCGKTGDRRDVHQPSLAKNDNRPACPPISSKLPASSSLRVPAEEVSEVLHPRTGSDLRSARDLAERNSTRERARLRHRPPCSRRSLGRREPCRQSQAAPAAALPLSQDGEFVDRRN